MVRLQTVLLIYLLVGVYVRKRGIVSAEARPFFGELLVRVCMPFMVFNAFNTDLTPEKLLAGSKALLFSFIAMTASWLAGVVFHRKAAPDRRKVMRYGTLISNAGFAGLPQAYQAYGAQGLFFGSIFLIPQYIFMWSAGISLFFDCDVKTKIKNVLLHPGMIAIFLGALRMLLQIPLPVEVDRAIQSVGDCTTPLSMITIGMIIADVPLKTAIERDVLRLCAVRLVLLPGVLLLTMKLLRIDSILTGTLVMLLAMPVGATTPVLSQKYGADHVFASKSVLVSTVLSLITVPLLSALV